MRAGIVLLIVAGLSASGRFALARTSQSGADQPRGPAFEYLGMLRAETGTRTVVENGPQGTRTIVQVVGGRFEGPRLKGSVEEPAGDWITNRADGTYKLDVRFTLRTDERRADSVTYNGVGHATGTGASFAS